MLIYNKLSGVKAVIALIFNLVLLLGLMAYIGAVMTSLGIAGFVLTIGIGVDFHCTHLRTHQEEIEANRGVRAAIMLAQPGFLTLLDTVWSRWRLVQHQPVKPQLASRANELSEVHRFADKAVARGRSSEEPMSSWPPRWGR